MSDETADKDHTAARIAAAAKRALAEAAPRRKAAAEPARPKELAKEIGGREGPEPTRYGDWEKDGLAVDF